MGRVRAHLVVVLAPSLDDGARFGEAHSRRLITRGARLRSALNDQARRLELGRQLLHARARDVAIGIA